MRNQHDSSAHKRWKTPLAALLSLTLGFGMVGVAPAFAIPSVEAPAVETTAPSEAKEEIAVGQSKSQETESSVPATAETQKTTEAPASAKPSTEPAKTTDPAKSAAPSEPKKEPVVQEALRAKTEAMKSSEVNGAKPRITDKGMLLDKTVTENSRPKPGEYVTYQIKVGCSSNTNPCNNAFLVDVLPEPLILESLAFSGFAADVTREVSVDKRSIKLIFNETSVDRPGQKGLNAGTDYTITLVAQLPENTDPKFKDVAIVNEASLDSSNGKIKDEAEPITPDIDWAPKAEITKSWAEESLLQNSNGENALTLGGIKNASKSGAVALKIIEPSDDSKPFDAVAFTGFGAIEYPEGADKLAATYIVDGVRHEATTGTANPNAPPAFPEDLDLSTIDGFEFTFTSSNSEGNE